MTGYLQLNFDKCICRGYNASKVIGRFIDVNTILLSIPMIPIIGPWADVFLQFGNVDVTMYFDFEFLAPSGAQEMLIFVCLSVCPMKSALKLTIFLFLSQVSLSQVSLRVSVLILSESRSLKYFVLFHHNSLSLIPG